MSMFKYLFVLTAILSVSCSHRTSIVPQDELEQLMTQTEIKVHRCLQKNPHSEKCVVGTEFEHSRNRNPASELIQKNEWFFSSKEKITNFVNLVKKLHESEKKMSAALKNKILTDHAIGLQGEAFLGLGTSMVAELANVKNTYGLYCSPGILVKTDVGLEGGLYLSQALSCGSADEYGGQSIGVNAGISGELIGLPFSLNASYQFGVDLNTFIKKTKALMRNREIDARTLSREVASLSSQEVLKKFGPQGKDAIGVLYFSLQIARLISPTLPIFPMQGKTAFLKRIKSEKKSLGLRLRELYKSPQMNALYSSLNLVQTKKFVTLLGDLVNGCDTIGGSGSVGLSISPVAVGITYSNMIPLIQITP